MYISNFYTTLPFNAFSPVTQTEWKICPRKQTQTVISLYRCVFSVLNGSLPTAGLNSSIELRDQGYCPYFSVVWITYIDSQGIILNNDMLPVAHYCNNSSFIGVNSVICHKGSDSKIFVNIFFSCFLRYYFYFSLFGLFSWTIAHAALDVSFSQIDYRTTDRHLDIYNKLPLL